MQRVLYTVTAHRSHPWRSPLCCWTKYVGSRDPDSEAQEPKYDPPPMQQQLERRSARNWTSASVPVVAMLKWKDMVQKCEKRALVGEHCYTHGEPETWTWGTPFRRKS